MGDGVFRRNGSGSASDSAVGETWLYCDGRGGTGGIFSREAAPNQYDDLVGMEGRPPL